MTRWQADESGQLIIEAVLLMIVLMSLLMFFSSTFQKNNLLANIVSSPWDTLRGMSESGIWQPSQRAKAFHPNHVSRHLSVEGE